MNKLRISPYDSSMKDIWDDFVDHSRNGTFLLKRDYMEYHANRFADHSLVAFKKDTPAALIPAAACGNDVCSHPGLTYGGLITGAKATTVMVMDILAMACREYRSRGFSSFLYKPVPHIYHKMPSEEDLYALFRMNATLKIRNVASAINLENTIPWRKIRRDGVRKALAHGLTVCESADPFPFWEILSANLMTCHSASPVHTAEEINMLMSRFPDNIRLFTACEGNRILGGMVIYLCGDVAHTQYISASQEGKEKGAVDLLAQRLMSGMLTGIKWFDFGTSNEDGGRVLNESLIYQKEGFGARAVCYDTYSIPLYQ